MGKLVVPPLDVGKGAAASDGPAATPAVKAIRLAFGVGSARESLPTTEAFRPTYHLSIPVFSLGGLDSDGVYEFDAGHLLAALVQRATRRRWGVRLELDVQQGADSAARAAVVVESPQGVALSLLTPPHGETLRGGGRHIVVATAVVTDSASVGTLDGEYRVALETGASRVVEVAFGRFEFEP